MQLVEQRETTHMTLHFGASVPNAPLALSFRFSLVIHAAWSVLASAD